MRRRVAPGAVRRVVYISCHALRLARAAVRRIVAGVIDMFAHTAHFESLAVPGPPA